MKFQQESSNVPAWIKDGVQSTSVLTKMLQTLRLAGGEPVLLENTNQILSYTQENELGRLTVVNKAEDADGKLEQITAVTDLVQGLWEWVRAEVKEDCW